MTPWTASIPQDTFSSMTISEKIRRVRQARGLTQQMLAKRARIARVTVVRIEQDAQEPTFRTLDKLTTALGITTCDLLVPISMLDRELRNLFQRKERQRKEGRRWLSRASS